MSPTELAHRLSSLDSHYTERIDLALARTGHGTAEKPDSAYSIAWARLVGR
jgi:alkanesulfonate monooxygenase SsuD/methylene tetrahydromethanopterin reductase-like flavin-dependent oxidoreductase (luciferase family)